jgi:ubiquinone/menaquinone biosynthesis C-methylase UbiE
LREVEEAAIREHGERRFRSPYHYAVFEYYRSAKVLRQLERAGVRLSGRVLDAGCGGGGIAVSFAEECDSAVGIDISNEFGAAGILLAREKGRANVCFAQADGVFLPFRSGSFNLVLSHSVIEHVRSAEAYLRECHRVLTPQGFLFLSVAPYWSFAGSHLSRLRIPIPIHLLLPRRWAFRLNFFIAQKRPSWLKEPLESNSLKMQAARNEPKEDDLRQRVTVAGVRRWLAATGFHILREDRHVTGFFTRNFPGFARRFLQQNRITQNIVIGNLEYVLAKSSPAAEPAPRS